MSDVMRFLEAMGQSAELRHPETSELYSALAASGIDPLVCWAILCRDATRLERLLGVRTQLVCSIAPAKDDEEEEEHDRPVEDDDGRSSAFSRQTRRHHGTPEFVQGLRGRRVA